jgi:hypothetical protein
MKLEIELSDFEAQGLARMAEESGTTMEAEVHAMLRVQIIDWVCLKSGIDPETYYTTAKEIWEQHCKGEIGND